MNNSRKTTANIYLNFIRFFALLLLSAAVFSPALAQQETGQIIGTVTDPNNAVIANASVVVKSVDRGNEVTLQSSSEGVFTAPNLQPGLYDVTVTASGFAPRTDRVQVTVGSKLTVNSQLGVAGTTGNTVDVVAGGLAEINTTDQQISNVVTTKQILELPTLTRNPYDLVSLSGNVSEGSREVGGASSRGAGVNINGQRSASTDILLDGVENVDTFVAGIGQQTPLDSVGEFRVITSNFSAENGRASGGIVNAITKSGTNRFTGTAYEFNRNSALASNSFSNNANGLERPNFNRNQFGYSIGGPVVKNKLFFFNSTEWTKVRSTNNVIAYIPTQAFINISNARTRSFFGQYGKIASNVNTTNNFETCNSLQITATCAGLGINQNLPLFQQVNFSVPADAGGGFPQNTYSTVTRIDYNLSDKTQIFGRYALESNKPFAGNYDVSPYSGFTVGTTSFNQNALVSVTHQFSSKLISQTKLAYNRLNGKNTIGADPNTPTLTGDFGINGFDVYFPGFLSLSPGAGLPTSGTQHVGQVNQDLTYILGNNNFRFGGQFIYIQDNKIFPAYQNALETLGSGSDDTVTSLFNGTIQEFDAAINPQGKFPGQNVTLPVGTPDFSRSNRYREYAFYVNDSWRVRPRVTLNLGLRYEYFGVQKNKNPAQESNFFLGSGSTLQEQVRNGNVQLSTQSGGLWKPDKNNFAPRVGIAWDIFGDGTTSLRGGYGIGYERNFGNVTFNVIQNPPNYAVIALTSGTIGGDIPIFNTSSGPLAGNAGLTVPLGRVNLRAVDPNIKNAYAHFWSASIERQVLKGTIASVQYSGSAGRDLYSIANINRANSGLAYLGSSTTCGVLGTSTRLNCQYNNINFRSNQGRSNYNGLTFSLDSNNLFGIGLTTTNRYTFSKSKDNLSSTFSDGYRGNFTLGFTDPYNPSLDYGYSDFDVRHRFVSSFIYDIPFGKKSDNEFLRRAIGGFQFTGQINANSGAPFTVYDCTTSRPGSCIRLRSIGSYSLGAPNTLVSLSGAANTFIYTDLSNVPQNTYRDPYAGGRTDVGPFPSDLTPRNAFRGPGFWNVNLGLFKNIGITENTRIQLRGEFFNVFNHANLFINGVSANRASSPYVTASKLGNRNIQLAVKFIF